MLCFQKVCCVFTLCVVFSDMCFVFSLFVLCFQKVFRVFTLCVVFSDRCFQCFHCVCCVFRYVFSLSVYVLCFALTGNRR